jgi:hypothetical protein
MSPSSQNSMQMLQRELDILEEILVYLDLLMYFETFISAGFGTWDKLMNITESELYVPVLYCAPVSR